MTETYNYWLALIHSGNLEELELEIKEEIFKMNPYMEDSISDKGLDEIWGLAEESVHGRQRREE
jgi:hypothetical protein|tara:strand:- start:590 stop:781 length:192 start_codon:yes stop_codon:yes gene_type:complete